MSLRKSTVFAAALAIALSGAVEAQARAGGGNSFGSRGTKSFNNVPATRTAPSASPLGSQPSYANQGLLRPSAGQRGGFFGGGFGRGFLGGLLGAGLLGMLFGHGFFGGMGGILSLLGFLIQIALVVMLVRFAIGFFRSRNTLAGAGAGAGGSSFFRASAPPNPTPPPSGSFGAQAAPASAPVTLDKADFDAFEASLVAVQTAYSNEDVGGLRRIASPVVANEFEAEIAQNRARGVVNRVSDVRLVQGDLAESWREDGAEYATVAMRFSLVDTLVDRASGRIVGGDTRPQTVTEVWTFTRPAGSGTSGWRLSALQQAR